jgi:UDP-N-acetylmuramoyl-tripeptide--D-alanyl-D-alanine ligase
VAQGLARSARWRAARSLLGCSWAGRAVTLVDDSYNANPDSVLAAIDVLAALPGPRWLVLGDMGEVGDQGPAFHAEVGAMRRASAASNTCGPPARKRDAHAAYGNAGAPLRTMDALLAALPQARLRRRCW